MDVTKKPMFDWEAKVTKPEIKRMYLVIRDLDDATKVPLPFQASAVAAVEGLREILKYFAEKDATPAATT